MVDTKFWKLYDIRITLHSGILGSLITNLTSDFRNSKWRIQYGKHEVLETLRYVDASENNFDEKVTAPNLKDSDSDNSGSDAGREKEVMRELWMLSEMAFTG